MSDITRFQLETISTMMAEWKMKIESNTNLLQRVQARFGEIMNQVVQEAHIPGRLADWNPMITKDVKVGRVLEAILFANRALNFLTLKDQELR